MSRITHDPEKHIPKTTQRIVLNNFNLIPSEKRKEIVNLLLNRDINVSFFYTKYHQLISTSILSIVPFPGACYIATLR